MMNHFRLAAVIAVVASIGACVSPPEKITLTTRFDPKEVSWFNEPGSAKIDGSALIQTIGGVPRTCAGRQVYLFPAGTYARERIRNLYGNEYRGANRKNAEIERNSDYDDLVKVAVCDAQGMFEFSGLPAGSYFIQTTIAWSTGQAYTPLQGANLVLQVSLKDGERQKVVLSPP